MEIELHSAVSFLPETFNVLIAPVEMLTRARSSHLDLQRYKILNICGRISCRLNRKITELDIRPPTHSSSLWPSWRRTTKAS